MLVDFNVCNFKSFWSKQTLSLIKTTRNELPANSFDIAGIRDLSLLKTVAIYGANASGKSNLLAALNSMEQIVTHRSQRGELLPITPFKLNKNSKNAPSEFEVTFIVDDIRYQYGFSANATQIFDEWLIVYPKNHAQKWFERVWDSEHQKHQWKFSSFFTGKKQVWQDATRSNALFLSTAVQLNNEQLKPVFDWFDKTLRFGGVEGFSPAYTALQCNEGKNLDIIKFLKAADFNISDIKVKTEEFTPTSLPNDIPAPLKDALLKELQGQKSLQITTSHKDHDGIDVPFDFTEESDGTQKLFSFAGPILDVLENGRVLCIDELNVNLHPKLVKFLIELFHNEKTNPKNAQLVFTTHETSILNQEVFRRDQIWFCERNEKQFSILYPLSDFSPKKGKENLELGYLSGRYGALPFIQEFQMGK